MNGTIERAAVSARPEDITTKLRNAPAWVRRATATRSAPVPATKPVSKPKARSLAPVIGWVAGVCCPGVSRPAFASDDGETLPEQFTPRCMESLAEQARSGGLVTLTWNHDGPVIASSRDLDLLFRIDRSVGLEFEARLRDTELGRKVLAEIDGRSLGVSIGFHGTRSWIVDRDGVGRMRVVDECRLHHVAVLPRTATLRPIYTGARCYGAKDSGLACPGVLAREARAWAFRILCEQAGVKR
jgi:hypothetical protein